MLTIDALRDYGADVKQGLTRCMNNEAFYLRLVGMMSADTHTQQLKSAVAARDLTAAFEAAHALKGVLSNLALIPALAPVSEMTEHLRARKDMDYAPLMNEVETQMDRLMALING